MEKKKSENTINIDLNLNSEDKSSQKSKIYIRKSEKAEEQNTLNVNLVIDVPTEINTIINEKKPKKSPKKEAPKKEKKGPKWSSALEFFTKWIVFPGAIIALLQAIFERVTEVAK